MSLSDLDNLYKTTVSKLPTEQRLWYCTRHFDKLRHIYEHDAHEMKPAQKKYMKEMIDALKHEIEILEKSDL